jgi:hypothetical protein
VSAVLVKGIESHGAVSAERFFSLLFAGMSVPEYPRGLTALVLLTNI